MNIKRKLISSATIAVTGVSLMGCSSDKVGNVSNGTKYTHTYTKSEAASCSGTSASSKRTKIEGKTGSITLYPSSNKATIKNLCYSSWLYDDGDAQVYDSTRTTITLQFKLKASDRNIASKITIPLPKTDDYISVPIDLAQETYVNFVKTTK